MEKVKKEVTKKETVKKATAKKAPVKKVKSPSIKPTQEKIEKVDKKPTKEPIKKVEEQPIKRQKKDRVSSKVFVVIMVFLCIIVGLASAFAGAAITYFSLNKTGRAREIVYVEKESSILNPDAANIEAQVAAANVGAVVSIETDTSLGSGVIISENGYILTNYHVVSNASSVSVTLYGGGFKTAEIVAFDQTHDIAVIKIEGSGYDHAIIGNSDNNVLAESVVIIGNPTGQLPNSVTTGIISSLSRKIRVDSQDIDVIQINASINSGNSGGALFNSRGELIGIVNAKAASNSGSSVDGIGFAIPINDAMSIAKDLIELGYVQGRIMLGLSVAELNDVSGEYYYHIKEAGLFVAEASGDAMRAGFQEGDYILTVDGKECPDVGTLRKLRDGKHIGDTLNIEVLRITKSEYRPIGTGQRTSQEYAWFYTTEVFELNLTFTQFFPA